MSSLSFADNYLIVSEINHRFHNSLAKQIETGLSQANHSSHTITTNELKARAYSDYDSIITIGYTAASLLFQSNTSKPVLSLLIPLQAFTHLENSIDKQYRHLFSSIYIDQPVARQLELIRQLSDTFHTVGIIFGKNSHQRKENISDTVKKFSLTPKTITVFDRTELISETRYLSEESDILLAIPDNSIYNKRSIKGILLTTYRKKIPVLGYSKAYVRAGALAAVFSSVTDISRQTVETLIQNKSSGYLLTSRSYPKYFDIEINKKVAHSLNIKLRDKDIILKNMLRNAQNEQL
ncbi:MAG: hypothetical protein OEY36_12395 [Gammaproteobacteria bacterium]|nr:hypothetical protein [Gammaproteobacteria bacterium]